MGALVIGEERFSITRGREVVCEASGQLEFRMSSLRKRGV
jgi:hypothetical protein